MATTDDCFKALTERLVMPGIGFYSISHFSGTTMSGQLYFKGADYAHVSILAPQGDGVTFYAGISGRSLNRVMTDAVLLLEDVEAELAEVRANSPVDDAGVTEETGA